MSGVEDTEDDGMTYLPFCNANQRIHCDYPNHSLVMPPAWEHPEVVSIIVYYDDSAVTGGQTCVVPRAGAHDPAYTAAEEEEGEEGQHPLLLTPGGRGDLLWVNDRDHAERYLADRHPEVAAFRREHLYPREQPVQFRAGTVLFYRHDVWHR
jgi:ectoine hydroxylase-related dioxygenase (phytanoyl-CoA dioxygenase family)